MLNDAKQKSSRGLWVLAALGALALHLGAAGMVFSNLQTMEPADAFGASGLEIGLELAAPRTAPSDLPLRPDTNASAASPEIPEQKEEQSDLPKETPTETDNPDRLVSLERAQHPHEDSNKRKPQAKPSTEPVASQATAAPSSETTRKSNRSVTLAQGLGESKERIRATWQKALVAHLARHHRYPTDRERKQIVKVIVNFVLDRTGHILSSRIVTSSGDASFDAAALSTLKRSDPVPPPPPDENLSFTLPLLFTPN